MRIGLWLALWIVGCGRGKVQLGTGPEIDGRLTSDVFTWTCGTVTDTGIANEYAGVFSQSVALQYAPDALSNVTLPAAGGCTADLGVFAKDAGGTGADLPDVTGEPGWESAVDHGTLEKLATGYWYDNVFDDYLGCREPDELLTGGLALTEAGDLTGLATPEPGENSPVDVTPNPSGGLTFGEDVSIAWSQSGWDDVWVQVRRERDAELWASVTCNATGSGSFTVDSDVWSLLGDDVDGTDNNLYVAFQKTEVADTEGGQRIELVTRSIAVAVIKDR